MIIYSKDCNNEVLSAALCIRIPSQTVSSHMSHVSIHQCQAKILQQNRNSSNSSCHNAANKSHSIFNFFFTTAYLSVASKPELQLYEYCDCMFPLVLTHKPFYPVLLKISTNIRSDTIINVNHTTTK